MGSEATEVDFWVHKLEGRVADTVAKAEKEAAATAAARVAVPVVAMAAVATEAGAAAVG